MRPIAVTLLALAACGDNRAPAIDAGRVDAASCVVRGRNLTATRIAWGCGVEGAPVAPGCLEGSAARGLPGRAVRDRYLRRRLARGRHPVVTASSAAAAGG